MYTFATQPYDTNNKSLTIRGNGLTLSVYGDGHRKSKVAIDTMGALYEARRLTQLW